MKTSFPFGGTALILLLLGLVGKAKGYFYAHEATSGIVALVQSMNPKTPGALNAEAQVEVKAASDRAWDFAANWSLASNILLLLGAFCALLWFRQRVYKRMLRARGLPEQDAPRKMPEPKLLPRRIVRQARRR